MSPALWVAVATAAALVAGLSALADGALLAAPADGPDEAETRERTHRALAIARVGSHGAGGVAIGQAFDIGGEGSAAAVLQGIVSALVLVLLAESVARALGSAAGDRVTRWTAPFARTVDAVAVPLTGLGRWLDRRLHELLPPPPVDEEQRGATAEQFLQVVAAEAEVGQREQALLVGAFSLGETAVSEIMVPRVDIVAIDREAPWSEVVDRFRSAQHSRLPVYAGSIDNIIGVLHAKDVLPSVVRDAPPADWEELVRGVGILPGTKRVDAQLRDFQTSGTHIAIVVDEYGGTAGLVTLEDILEEIVGEIRDEYDDEERGVEREGDDRFWVSGRMTLDDLSELVDGDLRHEDVTTVGGLIYELVGRVPRAGEVVTVSGFRLVVERVVRRKIERVFVERLPAAEAATDEAEAP